MELWFVLFFSSEFYYRRGDSAEFGVSDCIIGYTYTICKVAGIIGSFDSILLWSRWYDDF